MKNLIKNIIEFIVSDEKKHEVIFGSKDEIVEFDAKDFNGYRQYDRAYPDRFRVKYDENLNRIR